MTHPEHYAAAELLGAAWAAMEGRNRQQAMELVRQFLELVERADGRPALVSWLEEVDGAS